MLPADYLVDIDGTGETCGLCMLESNDNYWYLGTNFMRGFYVVFDAEMSRIAFAILADSLKDEPCNAACAGGTPTTPLTVDALTVDDTADTDDEPATDPEPVDDPATDPETVDDPAPTPETPDVNPTAHVTVG